MSNLGITEQRILDGQISSDKFGTAPIGCTEGVWLIYSECYEDGVDPYGVCYTEEEAKQRASEHFVKGLQVAFVPFVRAWKFDESLGLSTVIANGAVVKEYEWTVPYQVAPHSPLSDGARQPLHKFVQALPSEKQDDGTWSPPSVNVQVHGDDHNKVRQVLNKAVASLLAIDLPMNPNEEGKLRDALKQWEKDHRWKSA